MTGGPGGDQHQQTSRVGCELPLAGVCDISVCAHNTGGPGLKTGLAKKTIHRAAQETRPGAACPPIEMLVEQQTHQITLHNGTKRSWKHHLRGLNSSSRLGLI